MKQYLGVIIINILVIGNGFDLAHGLPTSYKNFLDFINIVNETKNELEKSIAVPTVDCYSDKFKEFIKRHDILSNSLSILLDNKTNDAIHDDIILLHEITKNNFWIKYFNKTSDKIDSNWINFEAEISKIVQKLDCDDWYTNITEHRDLLPKDFDETTDKKILVNFLDKDLYSLTEALEIYLHNYINEISCVINRNGEEVDICRNADILNLNINKVLSFNYTNTFERLYDEHKWGTKDRKKIQYNYIHGKATMHGFDKCNMILGINDYDSSEPTISNMDFIKFKKYFQRIHKNTGQEHRTWLDDIQKQHDIYKYKLKGYKKIKFCIWLFEKKKKPIKIKNPKKYYHNVYFFGHSLDVVDKDIIKFLILNDNVRTYIYYHDLTSYEEKIVNLIKIIDKDELVKRSAGKNQTLFFLKQTDTI